MDGETRLLLHGWQRAADSIWMCVFEQRGVKKHPTPSMEKQTCSFDCSIDAKLNTNTLQQVSWHILEYIKIIQLEPNQNMKF